MSQGAMTRVAPAWASATAAITAYWVAVAVVDGDLAPVSTTAAGAAAAAATAALVGAGWRPRTVEAIQTGGLALTILPVTVAATGAGNSRFLVAALAAAGVSTVVLALHKDAARRDGGVLLRAGGCWLVVAALLVQRVAAARWVLPGEDGTALALALAGAMALLVGVSLGPPRGWALSVPALVVALAAAEHLPEPAGAAGAAVIAAGAAFVAGRRPILALSALAAATVAAGVAAPAAMLLAAAAVLTVVVQHPSAAVLGLPGAAALAAALVPGARSTSGSVLAAGALAVAGALAYRSWPPRAPLRFTAPVESWPALTLAAWMLLAPGTWAWVGRIEIGAYDRGAAVAAAAAGIAVVGWWTTAMRPLGERATGDVR